MAKNKAPTFVVTGKCRLSYARIWEPSRMSDDDPLKYSACIIIPMTEKTTLDKIKAAVEAATKDSIASKWKGKKTANMNQIGSKHV